MVYDQGRLLIEKEYWLDRRPPRLIRRVIFRDAEGVVSMTSELSDYRPLPGAGPSLPYSMVAEWPKEGARMEFDVGKWELVPQVRSGGPQFTTQPECEFGYDGTW